MFQDTFEANREAGSDGILSSSRLLSTAPSFGAVGYSLLGRIATAEYVAVKKATASATGIVEAQKSIEML